MGGLHIHNWATGKSVHLVVYAGESISRFICRSGAVPRPANHTFPFPDWFSSSSVFINFYGAGFHQIIPAALYPMV